MQIIDNTTKVPLHQLQVGDVFRSMKTGFLYMKTSQMFDNHGEMINAINLESGILHHIEQYNEVIPVNCELIIK